MSLENFKNIINSITSIPDDQWEQFEKCLHIKKLKKADSLLKIGDVATNVGFITKGLFRVYFLNDEGVETNLVFKQENEIVAGLASLVTKSPSLFSIDALEDSEIIYFNYSELIKFYDLHPCWDRLGRKLLEMEFISKEKRQFELLTLDATQKYLALRESNPELIERIPQFHIASYLGVKPTSLNRILKGL